MTLVLNILEPKGVDQLYDGAGKAVALQVKVTTSPLEAICDTGFVVIDGLTTCEK